MDYISYIRSKVGHDKIFLNCVGAAIVDDAGKVLLQKRSDRKMWGFPGGVMELGESFTDAVKREVKEETGLIVEVERLLGVYSAYSDEFPNGDQAQPILLFFLCKAKAGELSVDDEETLELRYFGKDEMPQLVNRMHIDMFHDLFQDGDQVVIS